MDPRLDSKRRPMLYNTMDNLENPSIVDNHGSLKTIILLSRSWAAKIKGKLQMDMTNVTINTVTDQIGNLTSKREL